jgi:hypothetical protein
MDKNTSKQTIIYIEGLFHIQTRQIVFGNHTIRVTQHFRNFIFGFPSPFQGCGVTVDLPVKLTSSRRFILTSVRRNKLTTYFQY